MAPEQCEPDGRIGPPADVFGLAATLYTALTGTRPFAPCEQRFPQLTAAPAPLPRRTPRALADALLAGLDPTPRRARRRPSSPAGSSRSSRRCRTRMTLGPPLGAAP